MPEPDFHASAIALAHMTPEPTSGNDMVQGVPGGGVISTRTVMLWVGSDAGRAALPADVRITLLEMATRLV